MKGVPKRQGWRLSRKSDPREIKTPLLADLEPESGGGIYIAAKGMSPLNDTSEELRKEPRDTAKAAMIPHETIMPGNDIAITHSLFNLTSITSRYCNVSRNQENHVANNYVA